jgi:hypothetical protein
MKAGAYGAVDTSTMNGAQVNSFNQQAMNAGAYNAVDQGAMNGA